MAGCSKSLLALLLMALACCSLATNDTRGEEDIWPMCGIHDTEQTPAAATTAAALPHALPSTALLPAHGLAYPWAPLEPLDSSTPAESSSPLQAPAAQLDLHLAQRATPTDAAAAAAAAADDDGNDDDGTPATTHGALEQPRTALALYTAPTTPAYHPGMCSKDAPAARAADSTPAADGDDRTATPAPTADDKANADAMPEPAASDALDAVAQPASELLPEDPWAHLHASKPPAHARLLPMPPREQWLPAGKRGAAPVAALIQGCVRILSALLIFALRLWWMGLPCMLLGAGAGYTWLEERTREDLVRQKRAIFDQARKKLAFNNEAHKRQLAIVVSWCANQATAKATQLAAAHNDAMAAMAARFMAQGAVQAALHGEELASQAASHARATAALVTANTSARAALARAHTSALAAQASAFAADLATLCGFYKAKLVDMHTRNLDCRAKLAAALRRTRVAAARAARKDAALRGLKAANKGLSTVAELEAKLAASEAQRQQLTTVLAAANERTAAAQRVVLQLLLAPVARPVGGTRVALEPIVGRGALQLVAVGAARPPLAQAAAAATKARTVSAPVVTVEEVDSDCDE